MPELDDYQYGSVDSNSNRRDVKLRASKAGLSVATGTTTFTGQRQRRLEGSSVLATVDLVGLLAHCDGLRAGLTVFKDELRYATVGIETAASGGISVVLDVKNNSPVRRIACAKTTFGADVDNLRLMITAKGDQYEFSYQEPKSAEKTAKNGVVNGNGTSNGHMEVGESWCVLGVVDAQELTERDFTGTIFGLYANTDCGDFPDSERLWVSFNDYVVNA